MFELAADQSQTTRRPPGKGNNQRLQVPKTGTYKMGRGKALGTKLKNETLNRASKGGGAKAALALSSMVIKKSEPAVTMVKKGKQ